MKFLKSMKFLRSVKSLKSVKVLQGKFIIKAVVIAVLLLTVSSAFADYIDFKQILIRGNQRIDTEAVRMKIKASPDNNTMEAIDQDVRELYSTGFFEQIDVEIEGEGSSSVLVYKLTEKPTVRRVDLEGNDEIAEEDLKGVFEFGEKRFLDKNSLQNLQDKGVAYYQSKGYYDVDIDHEVIPAGKNQVDVKFIINEGEKLEIDYVLVTGLDSIEENELLDILHTKPYSWWKSWLLGTGRLDPEKLKVDKSLIQQYLFDHGYIDGVVSDADVDRGEGGLTVVFDTNEGPQYRIGNVSVAGDLVDGSEEKTLEGVEMKGGEVFNASALREDSFIISDKFADFGYAFANVTPDTRVNRFEHLVNVSYMVAKGDPVYINEIKVSGNRKTYDNVIRREFRVQEQELYSSSKIKRSQTMLERLGYFDEVTVSTEQVKDEKDKVNLLVDVKEGSTGSFSAGAGYSSSDGPIFNTRLSENNFMGSGRRLSLNADLGSERENLVLSLTDRRINDSFWSGGVDVLRTQREFTDFDREMKGGGIQAGYPLERFFGKWAEDISFSLRYEYLDINISNVDLEPGEAAQLVIDSEGTSTASGVIPKLIRNTINNPLNPTHGSKQVLSLELTGLGGSEEYFLLQAKNQIYHPVFDAGWGEFVFSWRTKVGYGETFDDDTFPLFRRFFPGGINTVRGYKNRTLGPKDEYGNEYGGSKQFINNFELIIPLITDAGLKLVTFWDQGQAFDDDVAIDIGELRQAYGFGIRWTSPIGPIRIEFGFPVDKEDDEDSMVTLFSFGAPL